MSSGKGYLFANQVIDFNLGGVVYTPPTNIYVALFNAPLSVGGAPDAEVSAVGTRYSRAVVPNTTTYWPMATNGAKVNAQQILFPTAEAAWGLVVALALMDAPTGGNVMYYGSLIQAVNVTPGDVVQLQAGALQVVER